MPVRQEFTLCTIHTTTHSEAELPQPSHNGGPAEDAQKVLACQDSGKARGGSSPAEETAKVCEGTS